MAPRATSSPSSPWGHDVARTAAGPAMADTTGVWGCLITSPFFLCRKCVSLKDATQLSSHLDRPAFITGNGKCSLALPMRSGGSGGLCCPCVLGQAPSHTLVMSSQQCKAPVMDIVLPCIYWRSWRDTFICHRCWKHWRWAWGIDSGEKANMDLTDTELAWIHILQFSRLLKLIWVDDFTLFTLPALIEELRMKCVTAVRALPELNWTISHCQPALP